MESGGVGKGTAPSGPDIVHYVSKRGRLGHGPVFCESLTACLACVCRTLLLASLPLKSTGKVSVTVPFGVVIVRDTGLRQRFD